MRKLRSEQLGWSVVASERVDGIDKREGRKVVTKSEKSGKGRTICGVECGGSKKCKRQQNNGVSLTCLARWVSRVTL